MAMSAGAQLARRRGVDIITAAAHPGKMTPEEAIELYEEVITDLEAYVEALREENDID